MMNVKVVLLGLVLAAHSGFECENQCERKRQHCEQRCTEKYEIGSMGHLRCNDRCREEKSWCRNEC